jgi:hypothetical protein
MMRQKNKRLGYGDDAKNWDLKKYENERRNLKKLERIKKLYGAPLDGGGGKKTVNV